MRLLNRQWMCDSHLEQRTEYFSFGINDVNYRTGKIFLTEASETKGAHK